MLLCQGTEFVYCVCVNSGTHIQSRAHNARCHFSVLNDISVCGGNEGARMCAYSHTETTPHYVCVCTTKVTTHKYAQFIKTECVRRAHRFHTVLFKYRHTHTHHTMLDGRLFALCFFFFFLCVR